MGSFLQLDDKGRFDSLLVDARSGAFKAILVSCAVSSDVVVKHFDCKLIPFFKRRNHLQICLHKLGELRLDPKPGSVDPQAHSSLLEGILEEEGMESQLGGISRNNDIERGNET